MTTPVAAPVPSVPVVPVVPVTPVAPVKSVAPTVPSVLVAPVKSAQSAQSAQSAPQQLESTSYTLYRPWITSPKETINAALAVPAEQPQPRQHPITRPSRIKPGDSGIQRQTKDLPYLPSYEAFIYLSSKTGTRNLWQRTIVSNTRQLRDILSAISSIMGSSNNIEVVFIARLAPADGQDHTLTFRDDLGLSLTIDGYPVPPQLPITIFAHDQSIMIKWSQAGNNNYNMELNAIPYPLPITWLWATQEPNAAALTFAVFDRERGPRSRRRRAALFEEFRQPDIFTFRGVNTVNIIHKLFPLIPTRNKFMQFNGGSGSGSGSGLTLMTGISHSAWNTITILFNMEATPRAIATDSVHHFFTQGEYSFGFEYLVAGRAGYGSREGIYLRGQHGEKVTYARNHIEKSVWYILIIAQRAGNISFGAYPLVAGTADERLIITSQRGVIEAQGHGVSQTDMHIGYGFKGLVGWIRYFDKYSNFEDNLHTEFTDSWVDRWHC